MLGWRGTLPEPLVEGPQVTWPSVMPGVDLVVNVTPTGYQHLLVVHDWEGVEHASTVVYPWRADGLRVEPDGEGGLLLSDGLGGEAVPVPAGSMWDARVDEASGEHRHRAPVTFEVQHPPPGRGAGGSGTTWPMWLQS